MSEAPILLTAANVAKPPAIATGLLLPQGFPTPDKAELPKIINAAALIAETSIALPPELIQGVLHQGLKGMLASSSKAGKTWLLLDLAMSVATGTHWLRWPTAKGKVLFVNFEISQAFFKKRL